MLPALFLTQEEIVRKIRNVSKLHTFENAQTISHIFYDVFKISYYVLERKKAGVKQAAFPAKLKRKEVTRLVKLIDYHHSHDKTYIADHTLTQCFGPNFTEDDALKFFENYVEGDITDRFGRGIHIDLEDGVKFMYKDYARNVHEMKSEYYLAHRGKRLPWIRHTVQNSTNIYTRIDGVQREVMYLNKYDIPDYSQESNKCYWAVIVKKNRKDKIVPYNFRTAFPILKYNRLLKRLERYHPITSLPNV